MPNDQADKLVDQLQTDYQTADLKAVDRAILDYATRLTLHPADIDESDILPLRQNGLDDRAIHDLCSIVSYFAFANRIANGLGIELENGS